MKSKIELWKTHEGLHFRGFIGYADYPTLDAFDMALMEDCGGKDATAADILLALECIFRRVEQQSHNPIVRGSTPQRRLKWGN